MSELTLQEFEVLVRRSKLAYDDLDIMRLFEGYLKLQNMIQAMNRPSDLTTGLAVEFQLEQIK